MKENILYAYHLNVSDIKDYKDYSVFQYNGKDYFFTLVKRPLKDFEVLLKVMQELLNRKETIFPFIQNVYGSFLTMIQDKNYVLVEGTDINKEYDLFAVINWQQKYVLNEKLSSSYKNEWSSLWSQKVDYLEYQIHELGKNYPTLLNSFSYYVGLAENAISYANSMERRYPSHKESFVLAHKRIGYPNLRLNFANPLNFVIDIKERDIAEYIKALFFHSPNDALIDLKAYIEIVKPDAYQMGMLFARLLYPTYYFDLHGQVIENNQDVHCIFKVVDKANSYENFLKEAYQLMSSYVFIEPVDWLIKKES